MANKNDAFDLDLNLADFLAALQKGKAEWVTFKAELSKPIPVALDQRTTEKMIDESKKTGTSITDAIKKGFGSLINELQAAEQKNRDLLRRIATSTRETADETEKGYKKLYDVLTKLAVINAEATVKAEDRKARAAEDAAQRQIKAGQEAADAEEKLDAKEEFARRQREARLIRANTAARNGSTTFPAVQTRLLDKFNVSVTDEDSIRFRHGDTATNQIDPKISAQIDAALASILRDLKAQKITEDEALKQADDILTYRRQEAALTAEAVRRERALIARMAQLPDGGRGLNIPVTGNGDFLRGRPAAQVVGPFSPLRGEDAQVAAPTLNKDNIDAATRAVSQHREALKQASKDAGVLNETHKSIAFSAAQTVAQVAKLYIGYRIVRDTVREVEAIIDNFVQAGITYQTELEQGHVSLKGILAENFNIVTAQGKLVTGANRMNALNDIAQKQWEGIESSANSVRAKTSDMVDIYGAVATQVTRLKGNAGDIQTITKGTAQLAQQLGISFKEAGLQMASVLEGKGGNRVAQALDLTKFHLFDNRDNPKLVLDVIDRLKTFMDAGASQTLGDIVAQFQRLMGVISSGVEAPFFELLRDAVKEIERISQSPDSREFFKLLQTAMHDATDDLRDFGRDLKNADVNSLGPFVQGVGEGARVVVKFGEGIVFVTKSLTEFAGSNRTFLSWIAEALIGIGLLSSALNFGSKIIELSKGSGAFAQLLQAIPFAKAASDAKTLAAVETELGLATSTTTMAVGGLTSSVNALGAATAVGLVALGLGAIIQKIAQLKDEANGAAEAMDRLHSGDVDGAILKKQQELNSPDLMTRANATKFVLSDTVKQLSSQLAGFSGPNGPLDFSSAGAQAAALKNQIVTLNEEFSKLTKGEEARAETIKREVMEKQREVDAIARILTTTANLASMEAQRKRVMEEVEVERDKALTKQRQAVKGGLNRSTGGGGEIAQDFRDAQTKGLVQVFKDLTTASDTWFRALVDANKGLQDIGASGIDLKNKTKEGDIKIPGFVSAAKDLFQEQELANKKEEASLRSKLKNEIILQQEFDDKMQALQKKRIEQSQQALEDELAQRLAFDKKNRIVPQGATLDDAFKLDPELSRLKHQIDAVKTDADIASEEATNDTIGKFTKLGRVLGEQDARIRLEIARAFGGAEETVHEQLEKIATEVEDAIVKAGGDKGLAEDIANKLRSVKGQAESLRAAEKEIQTYSKTVQDVSKEQGRLDAAFQKSKISVDDYTERTIQNRMRMMQALQNEKDSINRAIDVIPADQGESQRQKLKEDLRAVDEQMKDIKDNATSLHDVLLSFDEMAKGLSSVLAITGGIGGNMDHLMNTIGRFEQIDGLIKRFQKFRAEVQLLRKDENFVGPQQQQSTGAAALGFIGSLVGVTGKNGQSVSGADVGAAAATYGASIALEVAVSMYQEAVKKATDSIKASLQDMADKLAQGTVGIGDTVAALQQKSRDLTLELNNTSKARASAIKDILPEITNQISQLQAQAAQTIKSFEQSLKAMQAGVGPFGDFARQLFDLEKQINDYLQAFPEEQRQGEPELKAEAMLQAFLKNAKLNLADQNQQNNQAAIAAQQQVIDLMDEQSNLKKELINDGEQQKQIDKDRAQLQKDEVARLEKVADLQKQIRDLLLDAAKQEADIRRKGVLEAQISVAEEKANEIANLRDQTADQLKSLQKQLADAQDASAIADRQAALNKQQADLNDNQTQVQQQLALNQIKLDGAVRVANVEGAMFGVAKDRYTLASQAANLEVASAQTQVEKWRQTQEIIRSIIDDNGELRFVPPPGFPKIEVHIGNIAIDNRDQSQHQQYVDGRPIVTTQPLPGNPRERLPGPPPPPPSGGGPEIILQPVPGANIPQIVRQGFVRF
jgi:hypothetical protein